MTSPARDWRDDAIDAAQDRTERTFGSLLDERPAPRRLALAAEPHVPTSATERAEDELARPATTGGAGLSRRVAGQIARWLAHVPVDADAEWVRGALHSALWRVYRAEIGAQIDRRVDRVLRVYTGAIDGHARSARLRLGLVSDGERELDARRCEAHAVRLEMALPAGLRRAR